LSSVERYERMMKMIEKKMMRRRMKRWMRRRVVGTADHSHLPSSIQSQPSHQQPPPMKMNMMMRIGDD